MDLYAKLKRHEDFGICICFALHWHACLLRYSKTGKHLRGPDVGRVGIGEIQYLESQWMSNTCGRRKLVQMPL